MSAFEIREVLEAGSGKSRKELAGSGSRAD
jgi:hypothetical protein